MEQENFSENNSEVKRPLFLSVLCILTFISTGFGIMGALFIPAISDIIINVIKQTPDFDELKTAEAFAILQAGWGYYLITFVLYVLSFTGALMMWKLKKNGFHFYALANIALFYLPTAMLGISFNFLTAFFPAIFIGLYALNLKFMK